jgi:hypothetical protein
VDNRLALVRHSTSPSSAHTVEEGSGILASDLCERGDFFGDILLPETVEWKINSRSRKKCILDPAEGHSIVNEPTSVAARLNSSRSQRGKSSTTAKRVSIRAQFGFLLRLGLRPPPLLHVTYFTDGPLVEDHLHPVSYRSPSEAHPHPRLHHRHRHPVRLLRARSNETHHQLLHCAICNLHSALNTTHCEGLCGCIFRDLFWPYKFCRVKDFDLQYL